MLSAVCSSSNQSGICVLFVSPLCSNWLLPAIFGLIIPAFCLQIREVDPGTGWWNFERQFIHWLQCLHNTGHLFTLTGIVPVPKRPMMTGEAESGQVVNMDGQLLISVTDKVPTIWIWYVIIRRAWGILLWPETVRKLCIQIAAVLAHRNRTSTGPKTFQSNVRNIPDQGIAWATNISHTADSQLVKLRGKLWWSGRSWSQRPGLARKLTPFSWSEEPQNRRSTVPEDGLKSMPLENTR